MVGSDGAISYLNTVTGATSVSVPKGFPPAEWGAPKMQQTQTTSAATATVVESLLRPGSQKAKVVTIEFGDEEESDSGVGASAGAGAGRRTPDVTAAGRRPSPSPAPPGLDEASEAVFKQYKKQYLTPSRMNSVPILANLSPQDSTTIASLFRLHTTAAGSVLYNTGDVATTVRAL